MEKYSRLLMIFAHAIARREDLEAFVFSTRLTRVTRLLRQRDLDRSLDSLSKGVHDFSGGTRIGDALADFNRHWARRVLGHGAVVIIVSDGWDRGDPAKLSAELIHLRRSSHRLIWLNPLIGSKGYEPLTRGMAAALPHCDDFLAAHNLHALDDLGRLLAGLDRRSRARAPGLHDRGKCDVFARLRPFDELVEWTKAGEDIALATVVETWGSSPRAPVEAGEQAAEVVERVQVVSGKEVVAVREGRGHAAREGFVALRTDQRVEPDQPVGRAAQVDELGAEFCRVASVPSVAHDDHDRAMSEHAARPMAIEIRQRVADAGASAEIVDALAHRVERTVQVAIAKQPRDPSEPCREHERFEVLAARDRVGEDHQQARVALHRTAHVADQNQRPSPHPRAAVEQLDQLAARPDGVARSAA